MQHRWKLYVNEGERRIPSLVDQGEMSLPCLNPDVDSYQRQYDPETLWGFLQQTQDMSQLGLYLSTVSIERPTFEGKQWFIHVAHNELDGGMGAPPSRIVSWQDAEKLHFWNNNFREYVGLYQVRNIVDYSVYVSRCFGYTFLVGSMFDDDEVDGDAGNRLDFTKFYPSIHHYHVVTAMDEGGLWQPFNSQIAWHPHSYTEGDSLPSLEVAARAMTDVGDTMRDISDSVVESISGVWRDEAAVIDLADGIIEDDIGEDSNDQTHPS